MFVVGGVLAKTINFDLGPLYIILERFLSLTCILAKVINTLDAMYVALCGNGENAHVLMGRVWACPFY